MDWSDERIDFRVWKSVPGNPFADYDPRDGIALWSLWEMPSSSVGQLVRRGRPRGEPTAVRSIRLPVATWKRLEREAKRTHTTVNSLVAQRVAERQTSAGRRRAQAGNAQSLADVPGRGQTRQRRPAARRPLGSD